MNQKRGGGTVDRRTVDRLWRPAAQRQVRNAWATIHAERSAWATASSAAFSTASALVNVSLSRRYISTMDLGVLQDMNAICKKAGAKMERQQVIYVQQLLAKFEDQVKALSGMLQASKSMRTYSTGEGPLIMFSNEPSVEGDAGDGAGAPVFATLPLSMFEMLADEMVAMYESELKLKWLLVSEFWALVYKKDKSGMSNDSIGECDQSELLSHISHEKENDLGFPDLLSKLEVHLEWGQTGDALKERKSELERETLQVYLTALLIEVNIKKRRIEEIVETVNDEMTSPPLNSPTCAATYR